MTGCSSVSGARSASDVSPQGYAPALYLRAAMRGSPRCWRPSLVGAGARRPAATTALNRAPRRRRPSCWISSRTPCTPGIYAALAADAFDERGRRARRSASPPSSTDAPKLLEAGRAEFAILDIHDLGARARARPRPGRRRRDRAAPAGGGDRRRRATRSARRPTSRAATVGVTGLPSDDAVLDVGARSRRRSTPGGRRAGDDRVRLGRRALGRAARCRYRLLERRGRRPAAPRRAHARVPRRRFRRAALPGARPGDDEGDDRGRARAGRVGRRGALARLRERRRGSRRSARV